MKNINIKATTCILHQLVAHDWRTQQHTYMHPTVSKEMLYICVDEDRLKLDVGEICLFMVVNTTSKNHYIVIQLSRSIYGKLTIEPVFVSIDMVPKIQHKFLYNMVDYDEKRDAQSPVVQLGKNGIYDITAITRRIMNYRCHYNVLEHGEYIGGLIDYEAASRADHHFFKRKSPVFKASSDLEKEVCEKHPHTFKQEGSEKTHDTEDMDETSRIDLPDSCHYAVDDGDDFCMLVKSVEFRPEEYGKNTNVDGVSIIMQNKNHVYRSLWTNPETGKLQTASFSSNKYGEEVAFRLACDAVFKAEMHTRKYYFAVDAGEEAKFIRPTVPKKYLELRNKPTMTPGTKTKSE